MIFKLRLIVAYIILLSIIIAVIPLLSNSQVKQTPTTNNSSPIIKVLGRDEQIFEIELEEFLVGAVAGEMPADFGFDALKAQAVAARSYICALLPEFGGKGKHGEAVICTNSACCQAYIYPEELAVKWGEHNAENLAKIKTAVSETAGEVLSFEGKPVSAPFFSTCGGHTENSEDVWQAAVPYLRSVACCWDKAAPRYKSEASFTIEEVAEKFNATTEAVEAMAVAEVSEGGRVKEVTVGDIKLSGTKIRSLLGLNSAAFSWAIAQNQVVFSVQGFGHGVGMCQHGAAGMAALGADYKSILKYYYTGIEIDKLY